MGSSSEEEEDVVIIKYGQREEDFTYAEANNVFKVQSKFQLETLPEHVLNIKGKKVGVLISGGNVDLLRLASLLSK